MKIGVLQVDRREPLARGDRLQDLLGGQHVERHNLEESVHTPEVQYWTKTTGLLGNQKINRIKTSRIPQGVHRNNCTLGQQGADLPVQGLSLHRVADDRHLGSAGDGRPAAELKTVSPGQSGRHTQVRGVNSPVTELAQGKKPSHRLQNITGGPPGPRTAWGN
ncbi:hypothetical protein AMECASPLE_008702 [Ameca splendens]|uniref:Uncharacterized protein n=1 Tax=Ameca splendens TaxID=208324 RepID=A0ABV0ZVZ6_9TELE